jgi:hypothetical protein
VKHSIAMSHFRATACKWRGVSPIQSPEDNAKYDAAIDEYIANTKGH